MLIHATSSDVNKATKWAKKVHAHYKRRGNETFMAAQKYNSAARRTLSKIAECAICRTLDSKAAFPVGRSDGGIDVRFEMRGLSYSADVKSTTIRDPEHLLVSPHCVRGGLADFLIFCRVGFSEKTDVDVVGFITKDQFTQHKRIAGPVNRYVKGTQYVPVRLLTPFSVLLMSTRKCYVCGHYEAPYGSTNDRWFCREHYKARGIGVGAGVLQ